MARKPFETVMENVTKWAAPEFTLRKEVDSAKLGYPIVLADPLLLLRKTVNEWNPRIVHELEALYAAAKNGNPCIGDLLWDLMEKYREEKYDPSRKVFVVVAVLKYSDGTAECYGVQLPAEVLKNDKKDFEEEVMKPQINKIVKKIGHESDYWDVTDYIIMCHQI